MNADRVLFFFKRGSERSVLVKKNILSVIFIKGISLVVSLLYVPVTLNYLNPTRYGMWMTLTSIVAWLGIFDIGLGNGLRNKLAEALAIGDKDKARKYVSTAYAVISLIMISVILIFFIANTWINWSKVLNTTMNFRDELGTVAVITVVLFGMKFVLNIISTIFTADQLPAAGSLFEMIGNVISLLIIWILTLIGKTSLVSFAYAAMLTPVLVYIGASFIFFNIKYTYLKPSFKAIHLSYAKDLIGLGIRFFAIQIAVLVIFQSSNILIAHFFSTAEVTPYNITYKYYSMMIMGWGIMMTPLWTAFTHAKAMNDIGWIRNVIAKLNKLMIFTVILIVVMALLASKIISIWTSGKVIVQNQMVWIFALYALINVWNNIYSFFLNGISEVKIQIYTSLIASVIHIPLAFLLVKYFNFGSEGVVLSMAIALSFFAIAGPIQSYKLIRSWENL